MSIKFSDHARKQIKERKIPVNIVSQTVKNPERKLASSRNRKLRQRQFGSKILEVVTVTEGSRITVITVYYLKDDK